MASLFAILADRHGVGVAEVREAATHRSLSFDALVLLSFLALYALISTGVVTRILGSGFGSSPAAATLGILAASLLCALVAVGLGEVWSGLAETIRIGNGHASYRVNRIPWREHRAGAFVACLVWFWLVALYRSRTHKGGAIALDYGRR